MFFKFVVKELDRFRSDMEREAQTTRKAAEVAARIEGYRIMNEMKVEILQGSPGGSAFDPLTEISKRYSRPRERKPLQKLARRVRYSAARSGNNYAISVGYLPEKISKSWVRIAQAAQEGATTTPTDTRRMGIIHMGIGLKKRKDPAARFFFLRKSTSSFKTPARPILDPYWTRHEGEVRENIQRNFERKMRGGENLMLLRKGRLRDLHFWSDVRGRASRGFPLTFLEDPGYSETA